GTFSPGKEEKIETFEPVKCRFIKLKAISEINNLPWTSAAEIRVVGLDEDIHIKDHWRGHVRESSTLNDRVRRDLIGLFVAALSTQNGLWMNGADGVGCQAGSPEEVVSETLRVAKFKSGVVTGYQILEMRKVHIDGFPDEYTAALIKTDLGQM